MNPNKQANSSWLSTLLMIGIMAFGGSAAFFVLSGAPAASKKPELTPHPTAAPATAEPSGVAAAPASSAAAAPVSAQPALAVTPPTQPVVSAPAPAPSPARALAVSEPKAAVSEILPAQEPKQKASVKLKNKPQPGSTTRRDKHVRADRSSEGVPAVRDIPDTLRRADPVTPPAVTETKAPAASEPVVDFKPVPATKAAPSKDASSEPKSSSQADADPEKPVVKKLRAPPLVPAASKPVVVLTSGDKAWVRVDEQKTVVVSKGQELPGLGTYRGTDGKSAKFDSGVLPVTP